VKKNENLKIKLYVLFKIHHKIKSYLRNSNDTQLVAESDHLLSAPQDTVFERSKLEVKTWPKLKIYFCILIFDVYARICKITIRGRYQLQKMIYNLHVKVACVSFLKLVCPYPGSR